MIFDNSAKPKTSTGEKTASSTNGARKLDIHT
jgi:hypothetical protein